MKLVAGCLLLDEHFSLQTYKSREIQERLSHLMAGRDESIRSLGVFKYLLQSHKVWVDTAEGDAKEEGFRMYRSKLTLAQGRIKNLDVESMLRKVDTDHKIQVPSI